MFWAVLVCDNSIQTTGLKGVDISGNQED